MRRFDDTCAGGLGPSRRTRVPTPRGKRYSTTPGDVDAVVLPCRSLFSIPSVSSVPSLGRGGPGSRVRLACKPRYRGRKGQSPAQRRRAPAPNEVSHELASSSSPLRGQTPRAEESLRNTPDVARRAGLGPLHGHDVALRDRNGPEALPRAVDAQRCLPRDFRQHQEGGRP